MPRPHPTALMPVGTVIEHDGDSYMKITESSRDPFPWAAEGGAEYGDERMVHLLDDGGRVVKMPHQTKTAKDLPAGAEVTGRHRTWVKDRPGRPECWTSDVGDHLSDGTVDRLLSEGAIITRVPVGGADERGVSRD